MGVWRSGEATTWDSNSLMEGNRGQFPDLGACQPPEQSELLTPGFWPGLALTAAEIWETSDERFLSFWSLFSYKDIKNAH